MRLHIQSGRRFIGLVIALLVAGLVAGCGFQPRGTANSLANIPGPMHVAGIGKFSDLRRELDKQLRAADVSIAEGAADSASTLRIDDWSREARVLTVDTRNRAVEYELEESVRFSLFGSDGREIVPSQRVRVLRIQFRPQDAVLGSNNEAELLRKDMRRELAERIVLRLSRQY